MKKITDAYICYMDDGSNKLYMNSHSGRAKSDKTTVVLSDGVEVVTVWPGDRALKYKGGIYTDFELRTDGKNTLQHLQIW